MTTVGHLAPTGDLERPRSSSGSSKLHFRHSSAASDTSSQEHKTKHKHNDYSCYIHVINKTGSPLELVDSKAVSGHWATGSPAPKMQSETTTLIELTDPKGPHGSEGWCKYRFHHPDRSSTVSFKLKFRDPYFFRDENFLQTSTQYPQWVSLHVHRYETHGHPFVASVEISLAQNSSPRSQKSHRSVESVDSDMRPKSESSTSTLPEYDAGSMTQPDFGKDSIQIIEPVEVNQDIEDMIREHKAQSVVSVHSVHDDEEEEVHVVQKEHELVEVKVDDEGEAEPETKVEEPEQVEKEVVVSTPTVIEPETETPVEEPAQPAPEELEAKSVEEPVPEVEELASEPIANPAVEHVTEPISEPVVVAEPIAEPVVEPVTKVVEPISEPVVLTKPIFEPIPEPTTEPAAEPAATKPIARDIPEPVPTPKPTTAECFTQTESKPAAQDEYTSISEPAFFTSPPSAATTTKSPSTAGHKSTPRSSPSMDSLSSTYWNVISNPNVKIGVVAMVFLTTYSFTMVRVSKGLLFGSN